MGDENIDNLTIEERCGHKSWKARVNGYTSLAELLKGLDEEDVDTWNKYSAIIERIVSDMNDPALEKGLETILVYVDKSPIAGKSAHLIIAGVVKKCVASSRPRSRDLTTLICLSFVEIGKHAVVLDELIIGASSKNPKTASGCLQVITDVVKNFGADCFDVNALMKKAIELLEDRDLIVRTGAKSLIVELHKWSGSAVRPHLDQLKAPKLREIEIELSRSHPDKLAPMRYFRSRQKPRVPSDTLESAPLVDGTNVLGEGNSEEDPYENAESVDVLALIPADFYSLVKSSKWTERKEALESFENVVSSSKRIQVGDITELATTLINLISRDANVVVVSLAVKCLTGLASGMRNGFQPHNLTAFRVILDKMKEKKQIVVSSLRKALDVLIQFTSIDSVLSDLIENVKNKNPNVRSETTLFLSHCLTKRTLSGGLKMMKPLLAALTAALVDPDANVRENSARALAAALSVYGEKNMTQFINDWDEPKKSKIQKFAEGLGHCSNERKESGSVRDHKKRKSLAEEVIGHNQKVCSSPKIKNPCGLKTSNIGHRKPKLEKTPLETNSRDNLTNSISEDVTIAVSSKNWLERAQALQEIQKKIDSMETISSNLGGLPEILLPRIADNNPKIAASTISLLSTLARKVGPQFKDVKLFLPSILKAVGDSKTQIREAAICWLSSVGKTCGYREIFEDVFLEYLKSGSLSARIMLWRWLAATLREIPTKEVPKECLTQCLSSVFVSCQDRNVDVRNEASKAIGGLVTHLGRTAVTDASNKFFGGKNNAVIKLIDKHSAELNPPHLSSTKGLKLSQSKIRIDILDVAPNTEEPPREALLADNNKKHQRIREESKPSSARSFSSPQRDSIQLLETLMISANFERNLVSLMFDENDESHVKAMNILKDEISRNARGIASNFDLILRWISLRFLDPNSAVILECLDVVLGALSALKEINYCLLESEAAVFVPYLIMKLGDSRGIVQSRVKEVLLSLSDVYPSRKLAKYIIDGTRANNSQQRVNCLDVLRLFIDRYGEAVYMKDLDTMGENVVRLLNDRNEDVKTKAAAVAASLFDREGEKIMKCLKESSGNDSKIVEEQIQKYIRARQSVKLSNEKSDAIGHYQMDPVLVDEVERISNTPITRPKLLDVDMGFLNDGPPPSLPVADCYKLMYSVDSPSFRTLLDGIANQQLDVSISSVRQIDIVLGTEKSHYLLAHVDSLLSQTVKQLRHLAGASYEHDKLLVAYGTIFALLLKICQNKSLAERIAPEHLYTLIEELLSLISSKRFDGTENLSYCQAVNAIILNLLENSHKTSLMCALLQMMGNTKTSNWTVVSGKMHELCMKCLWKLNRAQSKWDEELDYAKVFEAAKTFLSSYGEKTEWKSKEDSALRTVKTILRTMVKIRGHRVLNELDSTKDEALFQYVAKLVRYVVIEDPNHVSNEVIDQYENLTASIAKELSVIFNRFARDPLEGSRLLDDFSRNHLDVNLRRILAQLSPAMLQYYESVHKDERDRQAAGDEDDSKDHRTGRPMKYEDFSKEARRMWERLGLLQEKIRILNSH